MSGNETNALQANFKSPQGGLFNVYGKTPEEFEWHLKAFSALVPELLAVEAQFSGAPAAAPSAAAIVQQAFPGAQPIAPQAAPQAPAAPASTGGPACRHGQMVWVAPANKPWKGWFCPQPKDATDKCPPQFAKG